MGANYWIGSKQGRGNAMHEKNSWASYKVRTLKLGGPTHVQLQCWPAGLNSGSSNAGTTTSGPRGQSVSPPQKRLRISLKKFTKLFRFLVISMRHIHSVLNINKKIINYIV
jgi:hypothetical protein